MGKLRRIICVGAEQERYTAEYDGTGARVRSVLNGTEHVYSYGAGLLHDTAGNTVYTPGVSQRSSIGDRYFHEDWLGSTRYLTDSSGQAPTAYRFDAFGAQSAAAGPDTTSLKFAGGWGYQSDVAMGLQLLGERYYDPTVGRFFSPDPIGFAGGMNLYGYCGGNPVGMVDPSGLSPDADEDTWQLVRDVSFIRRRGMAGGVDRSIMSRVNAIHERQGAGRFASGNEPLVSHVMTVYSLAEGGGISCSAGGAGAFRGGSPMGGGSRGPGVWQRFTGWVSRLVSPRDWGKNASARGPQYALGLHPGVESFARSRAVTAWQWTLPSNLGPTAYETLFRRDMNAAGAIHFDLSKLRLSEARSYRGGPSYGNYTNWEYSQILRNPAWRRKTIRYGTPAD
jgi:RHS repeat-associated protein